MPMRHGWYVKRYSKMKTIKNISGFALARDLLKAGENVTIRVNGQSMLPFFQSNSIVKIRPIREEDLICGHVVFGETENGKFVIHRIIRITSNHIILMGDGNIIGIENIARNKIYGIIDCSRLHLFLAQIWKWIRPIRKYILYFLKRICKK